MKQTALKNKVQLVTYPDSLGKDLKDLRLVLKTHLKDYIGGIHVLPFFPSSADRGFAPLTHLTVDSQFGSWRDIKAMGKQYDLVVDLMVNHISSESEFFQDFLEHGSKSEWRDLFLDVDELLARHGETVEALNDTYRPRPSSPICEFEFKDGTKRRLWCTFSNNQIDLDVSKRKTRELFKSFIDKFIENDVNLIRLDAVGYTVKRPKTSSFLIPETYELMNWFKGQTKGQQIELLAEIHHNYKKSVSLLHKNTTDWIYDFSLPLLTLNALFTANANHLKNWINIRPDEQITTLDAHDGIGVIDVKDLMPQKDIDETVHQIQLYGGNNLYRASGEGANNVDIYQINSTYYSALGENDDAYIAARTIQFFIPGIPQVYYVGLLAGSNDYDLFAKTNHGRDVLRHYYTLEEIEQNMERVVVKRLLNLMHLRNTHPAFDGHFTLMPSDVDELRLHWQKHDLYCDAIVNLQKHTVEVEFVDPETKRVEIKNF